MICRDCGAVFVNPARQNSETRECFGFPCRESYAVCPVCGSEDIEDSERCQRCGTTCETRALEWGLCGSCRAEIKKQFDAHIAENFTENETNYLMEAWT